MKQLIKIATSHYQEYIISPTGDFYLIEVKRLGGTMQRLLTRCNTPRQLMHKLGY